jgi:hypothetical protein
MASILCVSQVPGQADAGDFVADFSGGIAQD